YPSPLAESSGLQGISYTLPYGFLALRAASFKIAPDDFIEPSIRY
ncbi:MAG: hypothetical protein ACI9R7_002006, partial [Lysobacterales bacterium]